MATSTIVRARFLMASSPSVRAEERFFSREWEAPGHGVSALLITGSLRLTLPLGERRPYEHTGAR